MPWSTWDPGNNFTNYKNVTIFIFDHCLVTAFGRLQWNGMSQDGADNDNFGGKTWQKSHLGEAMRWKVEAVEAISIYWLEPSDSITSISSYLIIQNVSAVRLLPLTLRVRKVNRISAERPHILRSRLYSVLLCKFKDIAIEYTTAASFSHLFPSHHIQSQRDQCS
jgi:hypothetical protein